MQENDTTDLIKKIFIHKNINLVAISIFLLRMKQKITQNQGPQICI